MICHLCCILNKILKFETSTSLHSVFIHNLYSVPTFLESGLYLLSLFTHITSALITYDKGTLLDIGHRFTNLVQDTLSTNSSWPLEILQNAEENNGHRRWMKKHRRKHSGIRSRPRKRAHSPPLPSILLANVQSLENKMEITTWAQEYFQKTLSVNTIHRAIRRCRLKLYRSKKKPYLNMIHKRRHFLWAKAHLKWTVAKWKNCSVVRRIKFEVIFGKLGRHASGLKRTRTTQVVISAQFRSLHL